MRNPHSGLEKQVITKNWGSFWKKDDKDKRLVKGMKICLKNKGKPSLVGKSFKDLIPIEHENKLLNKKD